MAEKLKIISLGGLNEIGKNLTVYEFGNDILIVDCGMGFPDDDMYGIDVIIPDFTYLVKNRDRIRALVITHGHEDHIGGVPYLLSEINVPIFTTRLTAGLIEAKLQEFDLPEEPIITTLEAGESFKAGCFKVELIHVNHSVADAVALAIKTPVGVVIHTGDYKIDCTPIDGDIIDIPRFCELGKKGVLALCADSTNAEKPGYSRTERKVGDSLDLEIKDCDKRIIVTTFASNVHRIQQVINSAARYGRKVALTGRSMENVMRIATELGYMHIPEGTLVDINQLKNLPREKAIVITTGSQGESMSALYRMAFTGHKQIEIGATDKVILSASAIPGNEKMISRVIDELLRKGAEVVYDRASDLHASGHACREELKIMLGIVKPKFFIPLHGEFRHLRAHAQLAEVMGIPPKNIIISEIGTVIELTGRSIKKNGTVPAGKTFVDGSGVGDVGSVVLRDRKHLAQDGMLVVVVSISDEDGEIVSGPDIITRGFVYVKESEELMGELRERAVAAIEECRDKNISDWVTIKGVLRTRLSDYLYKKTKRNPMILPVIMEI
ncbi:MAG: ribonuclease J [Oscillospiraceae bacterium]|nr:ribonuclease J [Oscillospiraceae bacterium]